MAVILLDRDGVVIVNRATNVKSPSDLELLPGVADAIARLNSEGFDVAICTNQPEVARGVLSQEQLDVFTRPSGRCCEPQREGRYDPLLRLRSQMPAPQALRRHVAGGAGHYRVAAADTPFVGDQADDLKAAFHAGCKRVLVRTGLGSKTLAEGLPQYLSPVAVHDDLAAVVSAQLASKALGSRQTCRATCKRSCAGLLAGKGQAPPAAAAHAPGRRMASMT